MSKTIITKQCTKCKQIKPLSEFSKHHVTKDGYQYNCKTCFSKYHKEYHQTEHGKEVNRKAVQRYYQTKKGKFAKKNFRFRHYEQYKAAIIITNAIRLGKLPRSDNFQCFYCLAQAEEYHHWHGYAPEYQLDVIPVCKKCHWHIHSHSNSVT